MNAIPGFIMQLILIVVCVILLIIVFREVILPLIRTIT